MAVGPIHGSKDFSRSTAGRIWAECQPEHGTTFFSTLSVQRFAKVIADRGQHDLGCGCQKRGGMGLVDAIKSALDGGTLFDTVIDEAANRSSARHP
jgi:hypothetical protein